MSILSESEIARFLDECPDEFCDLVLELRRFVLKNAPGVTEAIKFNALCYFKPDRPFSSIGGNVCMISAHDDGVRLSFIHGAALPDPEGLLKGKAKAKRYVEIRTSADLRRRALNNLMRAAVVFGPDAEGKPS